MVSTIEAKVPLIFQPKLGNFCHSVTKERNEEKPFKIGSSGKLLAPLAKRIWLRVA